MPKQKRAEKIKKQFLAAYEDYGEEVFAFVLSRTSNRDVALDLTQDIFSNVWMYLSRGKRVQNLRSFLFRTARNRVTDFYRKKKSLSLDNILESGIDFSDRGFALAYAEQRVDADFSVRALSALSPKHYQVIHMRFVDDMSLDEIAFVLGIKKNAVSVRLHRALQYARDHLHSHDERGSQ